MALDFFDASINRVGAYVIGTRAMRKAILYALLDPSSTLAEHETAGRNTERLALMEEFKFMPFPAVWEELCRRAETPVGAEWIQEMQTYENDVQLKRNEG